MSIPSTHGISNTYLPATFDTASATKCTRTANSAKQPSTCGPLSPFAQLLNASGSSASAGGASSNPNQILQQLLQSFQTSETQNQGQSINPMSLW
jgi:hypothetical protein